MAIGIGEFRYPLEVQEGLTIGLPGCSAAESGYPREVKECDRAHRNWSGLTDVKESLHNLLACGRCCHRPRCPLSVVGVLTSRQVTNNCWKFCFNKAGF
jgi:hypothetical protein